MTIVEQITAAIQAQREEITRMRATTKAEIDRAQAQVDDLVALRAALNPAMEDVFVRLVAAGIWK
jgi:hypothetical protein